VNPGTARSADALARWGFAEFVGEGRQRGLLYDTIPTFNRLSDTVVEIGGRKALNFAGIDLLGWQHDPTVIDVFTRTARTGGLVTGGSRFTQGMTQHHSLVEQLVREATGKDGALTFASGALANIGFVHAMSSRLLLDDEVGVNNRDAVFVLDRDSHVSMWKAVERFPIGQQLDRFEHNDPDNLRRYAGAKLVVGFESVYSVDGSVAPIGDLVDVCAEFGAVTFVDDANGFLVYGPEHRPFAREFSALSRVDFIAMSFSKAVGLEGGAIAGPADAVFAFEYLSGTSMYTASIQTPTAAAIAHVMRRMIDDPTVMDAYLDTARSVRNRLLELGFRLNPTPSYATSIFIGDEAVAEQVRREFLELGYLVPLFVYPTVKKGQAVIRLYLNARQSAADVDAFIDALMGMRAKHGF
jgi:5-aminolevulinate synthase/8-amino-7-oxononanoate synthase